MPLVPRRVRHVGDDGLDSPSLFSPENADLLLPAATLLHRTIEVAPLNAHELQRVGGVDALVALFRRCVSMLTVTSSATALPYLVAMPLLRTLGGIAPSAECTAKLVDDANVGALDDIVRCLHLTQLPNLSEAALEACDDAESAGSKVGLLPTSRLAMEIRRVRSAVGQPPGRP